MKNVSVLGVGDLVLELPDIGQFFEPAKEILRGGDITIGQVELPHTDRGQICNTELRIVPPAPPENLDILADCGFNVASVGGNHTFDHGYYGVMDTIERLQKNGIATCGAGENIFEARKPAIIEKNGLKFAILEFNCIGPSLSWATPLKAGAAFVRVLTIYESGLTEPAAMPDYCWTVVDPWSLQNMVNDIKTYREQGYVVIVGLHIGRMYDKHLLQYEKVITNEAIDAGAEMILCHHAHEPRGIRVYKGKPIFHGLGNFVTLSTSTGPISPVREQAYRPFEYQGVFPTCWCRDEECSKELETDVPYYPFSAFSRNTLIAKATFDGSGIVSAGFYPCWVADDSRTTPVTRDGKGEDVLNAFKELNRIEELDDDIFSWNDDGTEVMIKLD